MFVVDDDDADNYFSLSAFFSPLEIQLSGANHKFRYDQISLGHLERKKRFFVCNLFLISPPIIFILTTFKVVKA